MGVNGTKRGFTLVECLVCTLILAILLAASIPFLSSIKVKQHQTNEAKESILLELSDINRALASNTLEELTNSTSSRIRVIKVDDTERLYKVIGKSTKATGYIVIKSTK